jgi:hypothetical protein
MAIGTTAAILGSAAIGAGASALSSRNASKATQQAAQVQQQGADASIAEQRRQFDIAQANTEPYRQTGTAALSRLSGLYGLAQPGATTAGTAPAMGDGTGSVNFSRYLEMNPDVERQISLGYFGGEGGATGAARRHYEEYGAREGRTAPMASRYDDFYLSPDYQFRQDEGARALTARNAALGIQDSGAAQRSLARYAGNLASGEYNNYANRLSALAGVGQTAATQQAQLGQNFASNFGNITQNNANNLASSYQQNAQQQNNAFGNIAGIGVGLLNNFSRPTYGGVPSDLRGLY